MFLDSPRGWWKREALFKHSPDKTLSLLMRMYEGRKTNSPRPPVQRQNPLAGKGLSIFWEGFVERGDTVFLSHFQRSSTLLSGIHKSQTLIE